MSFAVVTWHAASRALQPWQERSRHTLCLMARKSLSACTRRCYARVTALNRFAHTSSRNQQLTAPEAAALASNRTAGSDELPTYWEAQRRELTRQLETSVTLSEADKSNWDDVTFLGSFAGDSNTESEGSGKVAKVVLEGMEEFPGYPVVATWIRETCGVKNGSIAYSVEKGNLYLAMAFKTDESCQVACERLHGAVFDGVVVKFSNHMWKKAADEVVEYGEGFEAFDRKYVTTKWKELYPDKDIDAFTPVEMVAYHFSMYRGLSIARQLELKTEAGIKLLRLFKEDLQIAGMPDWFLAQMKENDGLPFKLLETIPAPYYYLYRNKGMHFIGRDQAGKLRIGFYNLENPPDSDMCIRRDLCTTHTAVIHSASAALEGCLERSPWNPYYCTDTKDGGFVWVTFRSSHFGDCMAIISSCHDHIQQGEYEKEAKRIGQYFTDGPGKDCGLTAAFLVRSRRITSGTSYPKGFYHCFGTPFLWEKLLGQVYRNSPNVFYQSNRFSTEQLYTVVHKFLRPTKDTIFLDLGCGTGAVGISNSRFCKKVFCIDKSQQAICDVKFNAQLNGATNIEFILGKVESVVPQLLPTFADDDDVVAVLDPNRDGFSTEQFLYDIRGYRAIKRIVFIACGFKKSKRHIVSLCKSIPLFAEDQGFRPVKGVILDMFPQTKESEWAILLERVAIPPS